MNYEYSKLEGELRYDKNIMAHYDLSNLESVVGSMSDAQRVYVSDLLYNKHYFKLNKILQELGLKQLCQKN